MPTILIADDSRLMQRNLTMTLQQAGYDLLLASDGREALSLCASRLPDLALLDCIMPELTGQEVCVLLRNSPHTKHIPVILISSEDQQLRNARYLGAQATLLKPIETKDLLKQVHTLLTPMPTVGQKVLITCEQDTFKAEVRRVADEKTILVTPVPQVVPDAEVVVHYDHDGILQVSREARIYTQDEDGTTLAIGQAVSATQRRKHFRKRVEVPVRYRLPGDHYRLGHSVDISGGGMRLTGMGGQLEVGMSLVFQIAINPSAVLTVHGIIRRMIPTEAGRFEVGVEFLDIDPRVQEELTMFLFAWSHQGPAGTPTAPTAS